MSNLSVHSFTFDNLSRIGNDSCNLDQRDIQNNNFSNHLVQNFFPDCPMSNAIEFATRQPNINFTGSQQVGINGCNIDDNSALRITKVSRPACRISLQTRPYLTVPYLGRGKVDPDLERQIRMGNCELNKKSLNPTSEISFSDKQNYPLINELRSSISDTRNCIEEDALSTWVRGGALSKDMRLNLKNNNN